MLARRRLPDIALRGWLIAVLVLLSAALSAQEETEEDKPHVVQSQGIAAEPPAPDDKAAESPAENEPAPAEPLLPALPVEKKRPTEPTCDARCQEAEQREKADLEAQESMATAAFELVTITWWQFWAGVVGISLLFWTLYYTRRAAEAATAAAKAAESAVKITSDTAERQLRGYLTIGDPFVIMTDDGLARTNMQIKNTGQTPAHHVVCRMSISSHRYPPSQNLFNIEPLEFESSGSIGRDASLSGAIGLVAPVGENERAAMARGEWALYVFGFAKYVDIFEIEHTTNFRLHYHGAWGGKHSLVVSDKGNEAD